MPQIAQIGEIYSSQLFWLAITFGLIFFGIGWGMLPKILSTVELRERRIAEDLERAQAARQAAEEIEARWRASIDAARAEAARIAQEAKQASAHDTEAKIREATDRIAVQLEAAEARIREAVASARAEIESVSAEAAQEMVARLTGLQVGREEAQKIVREELHV